MSQDVAEWLANSLKPNRVCIAKRLAANDTLANGAHQAGPYIPKSAAFAISSELDTKTELNPRKQFLAFIESHQEICWPKIIYYNNRFAGNGSGTRNETRLTGFGGKSSALLDPENTGAIAVFSFDSESREDLLICRIWVSRDQIEEEAIEQFFGPIEPGQTSEWPLVAAAPEQSSCWLGADRMPAHWLDRFPSAAEIVAKSVELRPEIRIPCDRRLLMRRECEYDIFRSVEHAIEMPSISLGFTSLEQFLEKAQTLLQRRKSRSGRSLELQTRAIFLEENLREAVDFSHQPISEGGKRPDFLFPSEAAYRDPAFPPERLRMLAVKTTCRDRWRQVISEADRIQVKHLLTLQEGVSIAQFEEMTAANVVLVVPAPLIKKYPEEVRPNLITVSQFIASLRKTEA